MFNSLFVALKDKQFWAGTLQIALGIYFAAIALMVTLVLMALSVDLLRSWGIFIID